MSIACTYCRRSPVCRDLPGPGHDHRVRRAALPVGVALPELERGVEGEGPAGRIVVVGLRAAELVDEGQVLLDPVGEPVEDLVLVDRPVRAALAGGAVVGDEHDQRVVELAGLLEVVEQPADLVVGVAEEARVHLRHPAEQALLVVGERVPRADGVELRPAVPSSLCSSMYGLIGDSSAWSVTTPVCFCRSKTSLAIGLVAHVEAPLYLSAHSLRHVVRRMGGAGAVVEEERLVGRDRLRVPDERRAPCR